MFKGVRPLFGVEIIYFIDGLTLPLPIINNMSFP